MAADGGVEYKLDGYEDARFFATSIPRLALTDRLIYSAILALSSAYECLVAKSLSTSESDIYHRQFMSVFISTLSEPSETWSSSLLIAAVVARACEGCHTESDSQIIHLNGAQDLLNHHVIARLVSENDLAEAVSWLYLRQLVHDHLGRKQNPQVCLDSFMKASAFRKNTDVAYANRILLYFAKAVQLYFGMPRNEKAFRSPNRVKLKLIDAKKLKQDIHAWYNKKPLSFVPLHRKESDLENGRPFPEIWMINAATGTLPSFQSSF